MSRDKPRGVDHGWAPNVLSGGAQLLNGPTQDTIFNTSEIAYGMCRSFLGCLCRFYSVLCVVVLVRMLARNNDNVCCLPCHPGCLGCGRQQQLCLGGVRPGLLQLSSDRCCRGSSQPYPVSTECGSSSGFRRWTS